MLEELKLGQRTLLVGKNASGKSRALMVMYGLAKSLASLQSMAISGTFNCTLEGQGKVYVYRVNTENGHVLSEVLEIDGITVLDRGAGGIGKIWAEKLENGTFKGHSNLDLSKKIEDDSFPFKFFEPIKKAISVCKIAK